MRIGRAVEHCEIGETGRDGGGFGKSSEDKLMRSSPLGVGSKVRKKQTSGKSTQVMGKRGDAVLGGGDTEINGVVTK